MVPATHITSIEEEDNEMDYGSQVVASDNTRQDPREMTSSSVVQQFMNNTTSTNMLASKTNSHLNSIGNNTLIPQIMSQDGTPKSGGVQHHRNMMPLQASYFPQVHGDANKESLTLGESIGSQGSGSHNLMQLRLDQAVRYSELCERRILDY